MIEKSYKLKNIKHNIKNTLNDDGALTKLNADAIEFNYIYDGLGRLISSNINGNNIMNYDYKKKGNRTSTQIDSISDDTDKYNYNYDELGNIIKIHHNDILEHEYYYDDDNELLKENDYVFNKTYAYEYDNYGNILYVKENEIKTDNQIKQIKYKETKK